mmetsp:Transcript_18516/g.63098  ORF Transcript_18516/g.63098 Transcript_18516/m.63098 type:complete len:517 (-) Transcript_18516:1501-3051(-)
MGSVDAYDLLERQLDGGRPPSRDRQRREESPPPRHRDRREDRYRDERRRDDRHRRRSRSPPDYHRDRRDDDYYYRGRHGGERHRRHRRERERSPEPPRDYAREALERAQAEEQRELAARKKELEDLDRDARTVFAYNLNTKADERAIFTFFSAAGTVSDVQIIYDRNAPKSKGMAYVEFEDRAGVEAAVGLTGQSLLGQTVMVKRSEAEKNVAWEAQQQQKQAAAAAAAAPGLGGVGGAMQAGAGPVRLKAEGLPAHVLEGDVRALFEPFGAVASVEMAAVPGGPPCGFVTFAAGPDGMAAMQQLDGLDLAGHKVRVSVAPPGAAAAAALVQQLGAAAAEESRPELDDEGGDVGLKLDSASRAALMQRLAGKDGGAAAVPAATAIDPRTGLPAAPGAAPAGQPRRAAAPAAQGVLGAGSPIPTECIMLRNLFDPEAETEANWWLDIEEDVRAECERFGEVRHAHVDKRSQGMAYLLFATKEACARAKEALHGRWFAQRQIEAEYQFTKVYESYFEL